MIIHPGLCMRIKYFCLVSVYLQSFKFIQKTQKPSLLDLSKIKVFFFSTQETQLYDMLLCLSSDL